MKEKILKKKALTYGWERVKEQPVFFVILMVIVTLLQYIPTYMDDQMGASPWTVSILALFINTLVGMGMIRISLKIYDGEKGDYMDLLPQKENFFTYLLATIVYGIVVFIGGLFLIVPGIVVGVMFCFYGYLIVDRKLGIKEAFEESKRMTRGSKMDLFLLGLILWGLNILGALLLLVGILISFPISLMTMTYAYRRVCGRVEA